MKNTTLIRVCYYAIKSVIFILLSVACYFWYMKEAIEDFDKRATTVTTRSINHPYEAPAMTICSNPPFKPSISKLYN